MPVTFNPSDKSANITLSNGDLTAVQSNAGSQYEDVRSTTAYSSGKCYFEMTVNVTGSEQMAFGVANATAVLSGASAWLGANANSIGVYPGSSSSTIWFNGGNTGIALEGSANGTVFFVAPDFDNDRIWFRRGASGNWNGNASYDPATNVGGIDISLLTGAAYAMCGEYTQNDQVTVNFGATSFTGTIPSGFSAWEITGSPPVVSGVPFLGRGTARKLALRKAFRR